MSKKNKAGSMILGVAFVWFTTHFGGGFASGAQIYSYYVRYGIWSLFLPLFAMAYNGVFFAYCLYFARKHEVYDYRSYNNAFYGRFAPLFSNLFELLYLCVMCVAPAVAFATGGATLSTLTGLPYLLCTFLIGAFIFVVSVFGTDLVRKVASVLSICIIAGLLIVYVPNIIAGAGKIGDTVNAMKTAVKVAWSIITSAPGNVLQQRCRVDQAFIQRQTINKRFEYRSRRSDRIDHIDMPKAGIIIKINRSYPAAHTHISMINNDHCQRTARWQSSFPVLRQFFQTTL